MNLPTPEKNPAGADAFPFLPQTEINGVVQTVLVFCE